ncbi:MAG: hypothetical protein ACK5MJ_05335 [Alphaproteobacteria bacterium]
MISRYNTQKRVSDPVYRNHYRTRFRSVIGPNGQIHHIPYTYRDRYIAYYRYYNVPVQYMRFTCR